MERQLPASYISQGITFGADNGNDKQRLRVNHLIEHVKHTNLILPWHSTNAESKTRQQTTLNTSIID